MGLKRVGGRAKAGEASATSLRLPVVVYVEDEEVNWRVCTVRLRGRYDLRRARNGQELCQTLQSAPVELILMDIQLASADCNGIELTRFLTGNARATKAPSYVQEFLRTKPRVPPILFITAYASRYSEEDMIAAGGIGMVTKPVDFTSFSLRLASVISARIRASYEETKRGSGES